MRYRILNVVIVWLFVLVWVPIVTHGATLTVAFKSPGSAIFPDFVNGELMRSDGGSPLGSYLTENPTTYNTARYYFIPVNAEFNQQISLEFRLEDIPSEVYYVYPDSILISDWGGSNQQVTVTDSQLGMAEGNFVEFTHTLSVTTSFFLSQPVRISLLNGILENDSWAFMSFVVSEPYQIEESSRGTGPIDRWYRLEHAIWPPEFVDGGPLPASIYRAYEPIAGADIEIEGEGVKFDPATAVTDSDGLFGVAAFVDPESFYEKRSHDGEIDQAAKGVDEGTLRLKYKNLVREKKLRGVFCEVIMVEGKATVAFSDRGPLKVGDILVPGEKISLSSGLGYKSQIGLRFVNGADCSIIQDVFTNSCIADLITIGREGIENNSVIQGNTALASAARTLCEELAGLPNTPEEWAKATGKVIVTTAVSAIVPVGGVTGFVIKYGAKKASGKAYDAVVNSSPGSKSKILTGDTPTRVEISTYYDGSTRIAHNFAGPMIVYTPGNSSPLASVDAGQWQEIVDDETLGRGWAESPDTIDQEGPELRLSAEVITELGLSRLILRAIDSAGIDKSTLSVLIDGSDFTSAFEEQSENQWQAELFGSGINTANVVVQLSDNLGHESILDWSFADAPGPPVFDQTDPGYIGYEAFATWTPPAPLVAEEVLYYEIRMIGSFVPDSNWYSVGSSTSATIPVPASLYSDVPFFLELRACDQQGRIGSIGSSPPLYASDVPDVKQLWVLF